MGANLCTMWHPTKPKSSAADDNGNSSSGSKFTSLLKPKCLKVGIQGDSIMKKTDNLKRKTEFEATDHQKKAIITKTCRKLTLEDFLLASPVLKPDILKRSEFSPFKQRKKRVHPSSKVPASSLISEAIDSLCLERPMNIQYEDCEAKSESLILPISRGSSGRSQKKVSFKLPHVVILYSPDEPHRREALCFSPEDSNSSKDSFYAPLDADWREESFDKPEEICDRLAVHTLPHVTVSSCI